MSRPLKLLPLLTILLLGSVVAAQAITWTFPLFPFYASDNEHGAMYFEQGMTATNGSYTGGLLQFTDWNYAGGGVFNGTVGFAARNDTSFSVLEAGPGDHILMQTTSGGADRNVTVLLTGQNVVNVTNVDAWTWDNSTYLLEIQTAVGISQVNIALIVGGGPGSGIFFIVPQWFIDLGGDFFGVAHFFSQLTAVMTAFVAWFVDSVANIISLIFSVMTGIMNLAGFIITWFGRSVSFMTTLFTAVGGVFTSFGTSSAPYTEVITLIFSADGLMLGFVIGFMSWFSSLPQRARKTGQNLLSILTGDVQVVMYWIDLVWGWSWTVFNFVYGVIMQFVSLLWGLIP